ncbi:UDP-N-acetylmuramoyl-L-alanine--D-glutamate ligase [Galbitalea soli]|uniref:UDP-N-acetylmuramoylalanine--D-glutamate ligase n=1 Tax=Galbitalea soli TaxID=1268042 RepID=A0A7C9PM65_9MICO|nr:UDP-N-acetylmuramoyl-L-alanine--D-glutamate ligase [Galbitalea soli]NEM90551.1 UDP-N-acetylmuramoyl-L-alanine--D-glutamate ligase [Galbitalea soli]NYJ31266.1 UDP-N-acetylmuramoylalanine--D-glutamate ligase [Galbitalea soli]
MRLSELAGRRILIVGTGREGAAAARVVSRISDTIRATDDRDGDSAAAWRAAWGERIPVLIAPDPAEASAWAEVVVKSPGVSPLHPLVARLLADGIPLTSGTDLWMTDHSHRTTAVTGSKGKSTTASLIAHLTTALGGDAALGGNIGLPLLDLPEAHRLVVELSSYQAQSLTVSPDIAVLTSLFPEHLDWHGGVEEYYRDKLNLVAHSPRVVIANGEDERLLDTLAALHPQLTPELVGAAHRWGVREHDGEEWIMRAAEPVIARARLALLGRHNALNACLALAAVEATGVDIELALAAEALAAFRPLENRLERIADDSDLVFVNDSLSTSPYATIEALKAFDSPALTLLVGGQDRGVDYAPLADHLARHPVATVIGLPASGERILAELARTGIPSHLVADMAEAVVLARQLTPAGGTVLLSPGAPSYGVYRDFADRAADFVRQIRATS